jgi:uncharacterized protein (DUF2235 family)/phage tail protein X
VVLTAESVIPSVSNDVAQAVFYDEGIGSGHHFGEHFLGGVFGVGMMDVLADAYRFLMFNYSAGDELYVFGFSRGAFTARSFVGLMSTCGILDRRFASKAADLINRYEKRPRNKDKKAAWDADMLTYRAQICTRVTISAEEDAWRAAHVSGYNSGDAPRLDVKYVGVWETVGALGVPGWLHFSALFDWRYRFHDTDLTDLVRFARHAVAVDERRLDYKPTLWTNTDQLNQARGFSPTDPQAPYQQKWFPGGHGAVGGGGDRRGLTDEAMAWVWEGALAAGLELDTTPNSRIYGLNPNPLEWLYPISQPMGWSIPEIAERLEIQADRKGPDRLEEVAVITQRRWQAPASLLHEQALYRPKTLAAVAQPLDALPPVDWSAATDAPGNYQIYVVRPGDTLSALAKRFYGDATQYERIFAANRWKLADPNQIFAGQTLRIPRPD